MLGEQHLRVVSVRGFPTSTWPGILDDLNRLGTRPPAPPVVRQAQERHRAAARNDLPAGKPAGGHGCQQQGRRRERRLAGAGQRSSGLRLPHRHGNGARCRSRRGR
ncbi:hypothetical protein G6F60_014980 [Rhizopus arrhizus]|nr:hypothetical protein G6F60_014980 [Rhizopus arrhizus]